MLKQNRLIIFGFSLILGGCTSVSISLPIAQVEAPYSVSKHSLVGKSGDAVRVKYSDLNNRPPTFSSEVTGGDGVLSGEYLYSPGAQIFFGGGVLTNFIANGYFAKIGAQPEFGNLVLRISGSAASVNGTSNSGDQKDTFGAGGYNWKGKLSGQSYVGHVSLGVKLSGNFMPFVGGSQGLAIAKPKVEQEVAVDDPGGSFSGEDKFESKSFGLGFVFKFTNSFEMALSGQRAWIIQTSTPASGAEVFSQMEDSTQISANLMF